jgi:hypothetical protein
MRPRITVLILVASFVSALPLMAAKPPVSVDCSKGQSINAALAGNADDLEVQFSGTCAEDVLIVRDRVTLRGVGTAPKITGQPGVPFADRQPGVSVRGADNVSLLDFEVTDSDSRGIEARGSSKMTVTNVTATGNRTGLLLIEQSSAFVSNSTFDGNTGDGIGVWENSALTIEGAISLDGNTRSGLIISGGSSASVGPLGATTTANGNNFGFWLQLGAQVQMSSAGVTSTTASNNNTLGVGVSSESHWSGPVTISGSAYGLDIEASGSFWAPPGGVSLSGNDYGLFVFSGAADVRGTSITGSAEEDVHLEFGARLISWGSSAGVVSCDGTELVRGGIVCPPPALAPEDSLKSERVAATVSRGALGPLTVD